MWQGEPSPGAGRCGRGEPSPGADVAGEKGKPTTAVSLITCTPRASAYATSLWSSALANTYGHGAMNPARKHKASAMEVDAQVELTRQRDLCYFSRGLRSGPTGRSTCAQTFLHCGYMRVALRQRPRDWRTRDRRLDANAAH